MCIGQIWSCKQKYVVDVWKGHNTAAATSQMVYCDGHTKSDLNLIKSRSVLGFSAAQTTWGSWWNRLVKDEWNESTSIVPQPTDWKWWNVTSLSIIRAGLVYQLQSTPFYLCEECTKNMSLGCFSCRLDQSADLQHDLFRNNWGPAQPNTLHLSPALNVCINNIPVCSLPKSITAEKRLELVMLEITSGPAPPRNPACWGTWADPIRPPSDELATFYLTFRLTAINQVGERCRLEWSVQIPLFIAR